MFLQNVPLTYGQVLNLLQSNPEFREDFFDTLQRGLQSFSDGDTRWSNGAIKPIPNRWLTRHFFRLINIFNFSSYFFETPPVTLKTKDKVKEKKIKHNLILL